MIIIYVLLGLIILSKLLPFLLRKWLNPCTFTFIFGLKGSSKSTLLVKKALDGIRKGWTVYTDMDINIPGVRRIHDADELFKKYTPDPHSLILLDEIGITWHSREFKSFDKRIREWFKYQRKYRCKVIANSQSFDIDKGLRELTDAMILQVNLFGVIGWSRPIVRRVTLTDPTYTGESKVCDYLKFNWFGSWRFLWIPSYAKYFNSFDAPYRPPMPYTEVPIPNNIKDIRKLGFDRRTSKAIYKLYVASHE